MQSEPTNPIFLGDSKYDVEDPLTGLFPQGEGHVAVPNADGSRVLLGDEVISPRAPSFSFNSEEYCASEGEFTKQTSELPGETFLGRVHWIDGEGCSQTNFDRSANGNDEVALIQRGTCFFSEKAANAEALGYAGFIVANDEARGDAIITMVDDDTVGIPGYFVGYSTGEIMKQNEGGTVKVSTEFRGYGYLRLLNVEDPANIEEVGQFATEGTLQEGIDGDGPFARTMHNIMVDETTAYISWYREGIRVVDFSNEKKITEVARYIDENGSNYWGVYLHDHPNGNRYILGSDMDNGFWVFEDLEN